MATAKDLLIVEPDDDLASMFTQYFTEQGEFTCHRVENGAAAMKHALAERPQLILIETKLPDKSGLQVLQDLREAPLTAHIPILFLAGGTEVLLRNPALEAGAYDFIVKPVDVAELTLRLRNALKRSQGEAQLNPHTQLPTGRAVQAALDKLRQAEHYYIIKAEIRGFDTFREAYDFMTVGEVLTYAGVALYDILHTHGSSKDLLGHLDDVLFVLGTTSKNGPAVLNAVQQRLGERLPQFHNFMERDQGYVEVGENPAEQRPLLHLKCWVEYTT